MDETSAMTRALELARGVQGMVSPRPPVGCVVVTPSGEVAGQGATRDGPGLHAEIEALAQAGARARGSTVFVSLEPCLRHCVPALLDAGVARVVAAVEDPNPEVDGRGLAALNAAGVRVDAGACREEAGELIAPFAKWVRTGLPLVTLKLAASLDGKVAAADGTSRWITGERARAEVHDLRRRVDAVLVGSGTVLADDPALTFRTPGPPGRQPVRVVLDSSGRVPAGARIFDGTAPCIVVTTDEAVVPPGPEAVRVPRSESGVDLVAALKALGARGICHVLVEGGPTVAASLADLDLVDELVLYLAPLVIGGEAPGLFATGAKTLGDARRLRIDSVERVGEDLRVRARRPA